MSAIKTAIKSILPTKIQRRVRQMVYGRTPMEKVVKKLEDRNFELSHADALEVFGRDGHWHTQCYAKLVRSLEVWEIQEKYLDSLHENLPMAKVKITDSFKEIKTTPGKYDLVVVDNSMGIFVDDPYDGSVPTEYCEHFDMFPAIFRVLKNESVVIVNVIPKTNEAALRKYPLLFDGRQLKRRADFYQTDHPENMSLEEMREAYRKITEKSGFEMQWAVSQFRGGTGVVYYLAMKLRKA